MATSNNGPGPGGEGEADRGFLGDTFGKLRKKYAPQQGGSEGPALVVDGQQSGGGFGSSLFNKAHQAVHGLGREINHRLAGRDTHSHTHANEQCAQGMHDNTENRYHSFAPRRPGNNIKWYVDGCGYMWAVSRALEQATQSIWILDWWLSPELYLRRPPARNEQYRVDRMLQAAAQRGVKVNIIVYKEVTQALTRKYLNPVLSNYLPSLLPHHTHKAAKAATRIGLAAGFAGLEYWEEKYPLIEPPITVSSHHTKHHLEDMHPNIAVFRHPDHLPDRKNLSSNFIASLQNLSLTAKKAAELPGDALMGLYGMNDDVILYWAHHEKLCLVDGHIAFMGGLDLCYGRWDTNQHSIADCHPSNLDEIVFPGQDYNNARIMDFHDVNQWQNNKLDRKESSRMGWSDISVSLKGPVVEDLRAHFVERWNFIYDEKYTVRKDERYLRLSTTQQPAPPSFDQPSQPQQSNPPPPSGQSYQQDSQQYPPPPSGQHSQQEGQQYPPPPGQSYQQQGQQYPPPPPGGPPADQGQAPYFAPPPTDDSRGLGGEEGSRGLFAHDRPSSSHSHRERLEEEARGLSRHLRGHFEEGKQQLYDKYGSRFGASSNSGQAGDDSGIPCQIVRSSSKWSHGIPTEHSIANAYISIIENSRHFVYIENQFFITATDDRQKPVTNKIGKAMVDRIVRAARDGEKYKMIIVIPSVPAFAGDLRDDASLGTRAIMEFQYFSINRGGYSIMESISKQGVNPHEYIRFYNLRNYDRINVGGELRQAEELSGVNYAAAQQAYDQAAELPTDSSRGQVDQPNYQNYQQATSNIKSGSSRWDTVSECYMLNGPDIREVPWTGGGYSEMDAFVSEELYVHSKVLIADDRVVICGSANLNDRSQLGDHDSEIAIIVEDSDQLDSYMNGRPYRAARFATTLRRQLFRKHLGLIPPQNIERPDQNFDPIWISPNVYDFGTPEDQIVADPLVDQFENLWNSRAKTNTDVFSKVFHPVPDDKVRSWQDYDSFYEHFFKGDKDEGSADKDLKPSKYQWGHVVAEEFAPGEEGIRQVKEELSKVRGTLVEMPLLFLDKEDIAVEGMGLNAFTEDVYT